MPSPSTRSQLLEGVLAQRSLPEYFARRRAAYDEWLHELQTSTERVARLLEVSM